MNIQNKEKLQKEAYERYQNFSEEGKEIRQKKRLKTYINLSEEEKEGKCWYHHD